MSWWYYCWWYYYVSTNPTLSLYNKYFLILQLLGV